MAFEQFSKLKKGATALPDGVISVKRSQITFPRNYHSFFNNYEYVEVLIDQHKKKIAFKPSNDRRVGFKLAKNDSYTMGCSRLSRLIFNKHYNSTVEDGLIVISVNEILEEVE